MQVLQGLSLACRDVSLLRVGRDDLEVMESWSATPVVRDGQLAH